MKKFAQNENCSTCVCFVYLEEWMADGGVALNGNGKSEIDAACQTHLSQRKQDWNLVWNIY